MPETRAGITSGRAGGSAEALPPWTQPLRGACQLVAILAEERSCQAAGGADRRRLWAAVVTQVSAGRVGVLRSRPDGCGSCDYGRRKTI
jgi:hypothetical protein